LSHNDRANAKIVINKLISWTEEATYVQRISESPPELFKRYKYAKTDYEWEKSLTTTTSIVWD